ncbi:MAG: N-acetylglucosamine-6-phosphate deacetylase [Dehalococcoidia bacterium]
MPVLLEHARVLTPLEDLPKTDVLVDGERIAAVGSGAAVEGAERINLRGLLLAPGFIDVHVHGGGGYSLVASHHDSIDRYRRWVTRFGITAFLAGTIGSSPERIVRALERGASYTGDGDGAALIGFHLEGPFLSPRRRGAFDSSWLAAPDVRVFSRFVEAASGQLRIMTIAPELPEAIAVIHEATRSGVRVSLGHTDAGYEAMLDGFAAGARHVTHCFNAMRPFVHRDPGAIAAALTAPDVRCELIADGQHVAPGAMRLLVAARGIEQSIFVTDGIELAGLESGSFGLAGHSVELRDGRALTLDGTLAGSAATMDVCIRNAVSLAGVGVRDAVRMATLNAAQAAGVEHERGLIAPGYRADLVALTEELRVVATWIGGRLVHDALPRA